jgi:hypothetical protein
MSMGLDYVSELRPPTGLLFIPHAIYEYGDPRWNDIDSGKQRNSGKTCSIAIFSNAYPTCTELAANSGLRIERPAAKFLSYGTALHET